MADTYEMYIADPVKLRKGEVDGFDISELAYDIRHTTSLAGQPGKLTFSLKQDPNKILEIQMGDIVAFWVNGIHVFRGAVFSAKYADGEHYEITCYDQMRYLKNCDYCIVENENIFNVFERVCKKLGIKYSMVNRDWVSSNADAIVKKKVFANKSYFDIFQYMINNANRYITQLQTAEDEMPTDIVVGARVKFSGDVVYADADFRIPFFQRSRFEFESGNAFDGDWVVIGSKDIKNISSSSLNVASGVVEIKLESFGAVLGWCSASEVSVADKKVIEDDYKFNFIRDNFGTLELNDIVTNYKNSILTAGGVRHNVSLQELYHEGSTTFDASDDVYKDIYMDSKTWTGSDNDVIIGNGSYMTGFTFNISIDKDVYNEIWVMNSVTNKTDKNANAMLKFAYDGTESENSKREENAEKKDRYGTLRLIINSGVNEEKSTEEAESLMKSIAKLNYNLYSNPTKTLKIKALGIVGLDAGDAFWLRINEINVNYLVYIISATHVYGEDMHTMELEVSTGKKLREVLKSSYAS